MCKMVLRIGMMCYTGTDNQHEITPSTPSLALMLGQRAVRAGSPLSAGSSRALGMHLQSVVSE